MSQALARWIANANRQVHQHLSGRGLRGGCTIVCSIARNSSLAVGYVGDCRAYHWNGQSLRLVTRDHSLVMSLVVQGELSEDELRGHADRSQVTRSLGERSTLPDYYVDSLRVVTGEDELRAQPGDLILLCSDGLWEPVSEDAIAATLRDQGTTLVQKSCTLITQSLQEGGPDNATVVLMQYS
jgi:PPM family protein phosphatase